MYCIRILVICNSLLPPGRPRSARHEGVDPTSRNGRQKVEPNQHAVRGWEDAFNGGGLRITGICPSQNAQPIQDFVEFVVSHLPR